MLKKAINLDGLFCASKLRDVYFRSVPGFQLSWKRVAFYHQQSGWEFNGSAQQLL